MAADVGQASACAGLQSRWRDPYERCGRRAKAPPQAEACPTWTGGPTLARKCEVIPGPALSATEAASVLVLEGLRSRKPEPPTLWRLPVTCRLIQQSSDFLRIRVSVNEVADFAPERRRSERLQQETDSGPG